MRRMLNLSKNVLRVVTLVWIVAVPVWAQEEPDPDTLAPEEQRAIEIVQRLWESGEITSREEAPEKILAALRAEFGKNHPLVLGETISMAGQLYQEGRYSKARQFYEQLVDALMEAEGEDHPSTLKALSNLAVVLSALGDHPKTLAIQRKVLVALNRILGAKHPDTLTAKANLAATLYALGDLAGAQTHQEEVLRAFSRVLGEEHPGTLMAKENLAITLAALGDLAGAQTHQEEVLRAFSRILGEEHPDTLATKANLAVTLNARGDLAGAQARQEEVLGALSRILGEEHPDSLTAKLNLAVTLNARGDLAGARTRQEEVLETRRRVLGEEHPATLRAKAKLAGTLSDLGDPYAAQTIEEKVLRVRSRILGEEHPDTLASKANLAIILATLGDLAGARGRQREILRVRSRIFGEEHPHTLAVKANLALTLYALGDLAGAHTLQEEVLGARSRTLGEEHPDTLTTKANLAGILARLGNFIGARTREEEVLAAQSRILGEEHPNTLTTMLGSASTLKAIGDLAGAQTREETVLEAQSRILGEEHPDTLMAKANLAVTLIALGDLAGARTRVEEVLEARSRILGEEHPDTLTAKWSLAGALSDLGDFAGARVLQEEVLGAFSRILGPEHPDTLKAKGSLAGTLSNLGDFAGARVLQEEVLGAFSRILGEKHPDTLLSLHNLAVTYEDLGELEQARSSYNKIIRVRRKDQGEGYVPVTENEAKALLGQGRVYRASGQLDKAQESFRLALDAIEAQTERLDLSEETRNRYRARFRNGYHSAVVVAVERRDATRGLLLSERYRAGNLRTLLRTHRPGSLPDIPAGIEEKLRSIAAQYDGITWALDGLHPKRNPTEYRRLVDRQIELRRDREVIQSQWLREQLEDRDQKPTLDVQGIRNQLDPGTALLVYNVGPDQTQLFVLSRGSEPVARPIDLGRTTLWQQVIRFRELVAPDDFKTSDPEARDKLGRWLFTKLFPTDPRLDSADRWLILADGPLHMLPFGSLIRPENVPGTWHYLAQHKPLHTVQSVATYAELRDRRRDDTQIAESRSEIASWVGFGDPIYPVQVSELSRGEAKDSRRVLRLGEERAIFDGLFELPNTEKEIQGIGRLLPKGSAHAHLGAAATEEQAWADMTQARFIHFATHGVALPHVPEIGMDSMDSFLALSLFDEDELKKRKLKHNGLLQAWEIVDLKLDADLVVLSACQTAIGEDRGGDGLISLSRAFQIAGARSVLASLWAVNDQSTAELMIRFYKHLLAGKSKDVALQEAQKEFIAGPIEILDKDGNVVPYDFSHPYYWAAFQLIGDWQ